MEKQILQRADAFVALAIIKNCKLHMQSRIEGKPTAKEIYNELKEAFKGKMVRNSRCYIQAYSSITLTTGKLQLMNIYLLTKTYGNTFFRIIKRADLTDDNGFRKRLKELSKSDKAKTEFLL